ncbi:ComEA family DNA-binding protein [Streptomyces sp.]|uniref:ComEA family DNA-binding protein n=1 Tax=Streptomyces sp. TaxID=1931 RepID=UPI002D4B6D4A|nr:ComEA family DNA-binding protein [Streptomyces sp.]HZF88291.1 ComEA family DNA-binding protein [Streptomyces sp.]
MALRAHTRITSATSGPGRGPASDGRTRRRRAPLRGRPVRQRHTSADELRRRARLLFGESGAGPPTPDEAGAAAYEDDREREQERERAQAQESGEAGAWRGRARLAVRERMPVWLQARVGLERRSVLALTVLLVVAAGFAVQHFWSGRTETVRAPEVVEAAPHAEAAAPHAEAAGDPAGTAGPASTPGAEIVVDVSGKVREPGIHRLPAGARVVDALEAAGGVRPGTDLDGLNRARFLVDGEQVVVGGPAPAPVPAPGSAGGALGAAPAGPVSLNTATVEQLDTLPGVGPVLAQHIIDYRTRHGGFRSVDELREVNGIGERRFADLRDLVRP